MFSERERQLQSGLQNVTGAIGTVGTLADARQRSTYRPWPPQGLYQNQYQALNAGVQPWPTTSLTTASLRGAAAASCAALQSELLMPMANALARWLGSLSAYQKQSGGGLGFLFWARSARLAVLLLAGPSVALWARLYK